jgi:hypothetical protein
MTVSGTVTEKSFCDGSANSCPVTLTIYTLTEDVDAGFTGAGNDLFEFVWTLAGVE